MLHSPYLSMPLRSPAEALSISLRAAQARLPVGGRVVRMDGTAGTLKAVKADGYDVVVEVELPDGTLIREAAGLWHGRDAL